MATDDVVFEFQLEQSIIITEDTLYLGIIDLETDLCHGKLLMRTVKPDAKVNRKRGLRVQEVQWRRRKCSFAITAITSQAPSR